MNTFKTLSLCALLCISSLGSLKAQYGFSSITAKITPINGETSLLFGGMGAFSLGNFYLGGGGMGLQNGETHALTSEGKLQTDLSLGYGGLIFGHHHDFNSTFQLYAQNFMAWGGYSWKDDDGGSFFLLEPEVGINLKTSMFYNLSLGLGYRLALPTSDGNLDLSQLSGFTATIAMKFGQL